MPVAINQNFDVVVGVVNGSCGTLKKIRHFTNNMGHRVLKSCVVEIHGAEDVEVPHLPKHHFPILPETTELRFEHGGSHKRCTIQRKQVPIEPGFAMTVHKAQGRTMRRVVVDLEGCSGTEPPYVMVSHATSMNGLFVLRDFGMKQITKWRSEELRNEFLRLSYLKWKTVSKCGLGDEVENARRVMADLSKKEENRPTKRKHQSRSGSNKKIKKNA